MSYQVIWSQRAKIDLEALDKKIHERIVAKVESIKENPFDFVKRLTGVPLFSLRIGDYRAILDIKGSQMIIFVVRVGHRKSVYGEL